LGVLWWIALVVKPISVVLLPVLFKWKRWRAAVFAIALYALVSLPYAVADRREISHAIGVMATEPMSKWKELTEEQEGRYLLPFFRNIGRHVLVEPKDEVTRDWGHLGLRSALLSLTESDRALTIISYSLLVAALLVTIFRRCSAAGVYGMWIMAYLLTYKNVLEHHYVFALPALASLWLERRSWWIVLSWGLLALPTPFALIELCRNVPYPGPEHVDNLGYIVYHLSKPLPAAMMFVYLLVWPDKRKELK
jgi:hypothetical protein